ncbi:MAG TPA: hypothetical protein VJZ00_23625 [Thermoanaerobaculia bacterium]|nr:hypothetical protein [Thermoanaerobaculia bacterium]
MSTSSLGQLLSGGVVNKIEALYDGVKNSGVLDPVGTDAFALQDVAVSASNPSLKVFDLTASLGADAKAQVTINAASAQIAPFDGSEGLSAPSGSSYAQLHVEGKLSAGAKGAVSKIPLSISASAAASFAYDHYLPAAATDKRIDALTRLVTSAQLPQFEPLATMQSGEISSFTAALNFDFGLQAKYGSSFDVDRVVKLFDGLSGDIKVNVQYAIAASLGWSLFDDITMVVAKAQQQKDPNWVRVRIDRERKNELTAGASFALQVNYDASSIGTALEKAFSMTPLPRAIAILTTVKNGDWSTITNSISDRASDDLITLLAGTGWKQKAADSEDVKNALAAINKVVSIYNGVDAKVQQLWSDLLVRADLAPGTDLRKTIDAIAAIDPANPNLKQFLSPEAQKTLEMLETLTGKSIEQLLVGSNAAVEQALTRAVSLAKQLERVITDTPTEVTGALAKFAKAHGIQSAIQWLSANATSLDKIEAFADDEIKKIVAKAVGKAFSAINPDDLKAVQAWATKIVDAWDDLSAKLAAAAKFLKGTLGFNASIEFSRVSESSAVLDFELDPSNAATVKAVSSKLAMGNVRELLAAFDDLDDASYSIRESVLTSRHLRTGATSVLLSVLGLSSLQKITGTRFEESVVHMADSGRTGSYSGGFIQSVIAGNATSECRAWIEADASDAMKDPSKPYATVARSMRLTFARTDSKSDSEELGALRTLLADLGFLASEGQTLDAPAGAETSFTMDISLDENAVAAFATEDGEANWNNDYRNAAYRLLRDDMVTDRLASVGQPIGEVLASVVKSDLFGNSWTDTSESIFKKLYTTNKLQVNGKTLQILDAVSNQFIPPYIPIKMVIKRRPNGLGSLASLRGGLTASGDRTASSLTKLASGAAATFANTSLSEWDNPMFNFWFVVARLCRLGSDVLKNATGLATFRFRASSTDAFSTPMQWSLTQGVPTAPIKARQLFPFA